MGVVENLVSRSDNVVRGTKVRVVTKGKPTHLSRPVQKLYPSEIKSQGQGDAERSVQAVKIAQEPFRAGMRHQICSGNHALCLTLGESRGESVVTSYSYYFLELLSS